MTTKHPQSTTSFKSAQVIANEQSRPSGVSAGLVGLQGGISDGYLTPLSNTGVTWTYPEEYVTCGLDWLGYSVSCDVRTELAFFQHPELRVTGEVLRARRGYDMAVGLTYGRVDWHSTRPQQKRGVQFSGSDLAGLDSVGVKQEDLLRYAVLEVGGQPSRVDFRIDYYKPADVLDIHREWAAGDLQTEARRVTRVITEREDCEDEVTVYIGSRQSERFLRVYTKGVKEGAPFPWARVELEMKGGYALQWVVAALAHGIPVAGCAAVRDFCMARAEWYQEAVAGDAVRIAPVGRKRTATLEWMLAVVVPLQTEMLIAEKCAGGGELTSAMRAMWANVGEAHS